jgi:hypothetical protein
MFLLSYIVFKFRVIRSFFMRFRVIFLSRMLTITVERPCGARKKKEQRKEKTLIGRRAYKEKKAPARRARPKSEHGPRESAG